MIDRDQVVQGLLVEFNNRVLNRQYEVREGGGSLNHHQN